MHDIVNNIKPGSWGAWKIAFRPKTLWVATVPVVCATALMFALHYPIHLPSLILAMLCAIMIQVITNLQNDVGYTARGHETGARVGMPRATQTGLLTPRQIRRGLLFCVLVTTLLGLPLVIWHGWLVLLIGAGSMVAAVLYMAGTRPLAYTAWSEVVVFIFFGLVAVNGTTYLFAHRGLAVSWCLSVAIGLLAAAVLLVNNYRDAEHDRNTGRHTLVVTLGQRKSQIIYGLMIFTPFVLLLPLAHITPLFLLSWLTLPFAVRTYHALASSAPGLHFNDILIRTVRLEALFGFFFTLGGVLARLLP